MSLGFVKMKDEPTEWWNIRSALTNAQLPEKDVASCSLLHNAIARQRRTFRPASVSPTQPFCGIVAPRYRDIRKGVGLRVPGHDVVSRPVFFNVLYGPLTMTSTLTDV